MIRPCLRHESERDCAEIVKTRAKAEGYYLSEVSNGRHKAEWPGEVAERALPFVCGRHVAPGTGVR